MRPYIRIAFCYLLAGGVSFAADGPPAWAYGTGDTAANPAPTARPAPDTSLKHLSGSEAAFTLAQIAARFDPADWYPGDHPKMPEIVAHGRKPDIWACGLCHYP